jgi:enoyl-CoA hydratase/carnithine racemase
LKQPFARLEEDPELQVGVLTGAGRGFSAGLDLKRVLVDGRPKNLIKLFARGCKKPLVAAVEGSALAGELEPALTCDLIVAAEDAKFGIPEVRVGSFAAVGALFRLPYLIGTAKTMELALTGDSLLAAAAQQFGLVVRVTEKGALQRACDLATRIAVIAPIPIQISKRLVRSAAGLKDDEGWKTPFAGLGAFRKQRGFQGRTAGVCREAPACLVRSMICFEAQIVAPKTIDLSVLAVITLEVSRVSGFTNLRGDEVRESARRRFRGPSGR